MPLARCNAGTAGVLARNVHSLIPLSYKLKGNFDGYHHGFVAQDVEKLLQKTYGNSDWKVVSISDTTEKYLSLAYIELIADIVATIQTHNDRIKKLEGVA